MTFNSLLGLLALHLLPLSSASLTCRPEGPVVPRPRHLQDSPVFKEAGANLTQALDDAVSGAIAAGWPVENASFSLAVVSLDQPDPAAPLWEYHHLAEANTRGTTDLGRDSQYLIGSISKVFSDYVLLMSGVDPDTPVTELLPRLADPGAAIRWEDISLRELSSYLAGVPMHYGFSEYYYLKEVFEAYGFPPVSDSDYPPCGVAALNGACSQDEYLQGMLTSAPVAPVAARPAYSNVGFALTAMALCEATGKNYTQLIRELVSEPLGMHSTFPSPGDDAKAVIPPGESSWGADYGIDAPGGGLVSSLADLSRFAHGLLSRALPLGPAATRAWLKPASFAGGPSSAAGLPWEIYRADDLTPAHPHPVTLYSKGGGAQAYRSHLAVADEYGVAIVALTAGPMHALTYIQDALAATWLPAVDEAARGQAEASYARTFHSGGAGGNASHVVEATLELDNDSLVLTALERDGKDILTGITELWDLTVGTYVMPIGPTIRAFPSDVTEETTLPDGTKATREMWRLWPELEADEGASNLPSAGMAAKDCVAWTVGDWVHYGGEPLDRVDFFRGEDGEVVGMDVPFLRSGVLLPV